MEAVQAEAENLIPGKAMTTRVDSREASRSALAAALVLAGALVEMQSRAGRCQ